MQYKNCLPDETAYEKLQRMTNFFAHEYTSLLDQLPSVEALEEYFDLFKTYDTDFLQVIMEMIEEGADPKPLKDFCKKYDLNWI